MPTKIFKDLNTKQSQTIERLRLQGVRYAQKMVTKDGQQTTETDIDNPEKAIENGQVLEDTFFEYFLQQIDEKERQEIVDSRVLYDDFKQDVLDWATDNCILWIIKLGLCPQHEAITELLNENPKYNNFRQKTVQKEIEKWIKEKVIDNKILEKIKEKDKKK